MYKGYTRETAVNEYAVTFFALLEEGYQKEAKHYQMLANIVLLPHMEPQAREEFLSDLRNASLSIDDILNLDEDDGSGLQQLERML